MHRRTVLLGGAALSGLPAVISVRAADSGSVNVLYAGSLVNLMEHGIGPAFDKSGGGTFEGYAGGSNGLANQIKGQAAPGRCVHQRQSA